mgnify:CR=1 FL=1
MTTPLILREDHNGVALLTIANPPVNALGLALRRELADLVAALENDDSIRAVVLTGQGKVFVGGADITEFDRPPEAPHLPDVIAAIESSRKPWIAALNGAALGGGAELALGCHYRLFADTACLALPETRLGIIPGAGGTQRLSRLLPPALAREMLYLGEPINASTALAHGLVNAVVAPGEVMNEARAWASRITRLPPLALRSAKTLVHTAALGGLANGIDAERQAVAYLMQTADAAEGLRAFLDKRAPRFEGK